MLCAKVGKCSCSTLYEQKNLVGIQILRAYTGIGDAETQTLGMLQKPRDLPQVCPRPKKFKRLATRYTLHGLRPNLRHRGLDGRIVPTPSDLSGKGASTKRYARKKKNDNYTYSYNTCIQHLLMVPQVGMYAILQKKSARGEKGG